MLQEHEDISSREKKQLDILNLLMPGYGGGLSLMKTEFGGGLFGKAAFGNQP